MAFSFGDCLGDAVNFKWLLARAGPAIRYVTSFVAGAIAGVVFWVLRTPTPVPPLIGLVGLLSIACGEAIARRVVAAVRRRQAGKTRSQPIVAAGSTFAKH